MSEIKSQIFVKGTRFLEYSRKQDLQIQEPTRTLPCIVSYMGSRSWAENVLDNPPISPRPLNYLSHTPPLHHPVSIFPRLCLLTLLVLFFFCFFT